MEYSQFYEEFGTPFTGRKKKRVQEFLKSMQLQYDEGVEYTVNLTTQDGQIAATGSLQQNVIKCVAVDDRYQGEGLSRGYPAFKPCLRSGTAASLCLYQTKKQGNVFRPGIFSNY